MSKIKKVLAMLLALAMVLGTTLTAFAAGTAKITVENAGQNATFNYVQIIKANPTTTTGWEIIDTYEQYFTGVGAFEGLDEQNILAGMIYSVNKNADKGVEIQNFDTKYVNALKALFEDIPEGTDGASKEVSEAGVYFIKGNETDYTYTPMAAYVAFDEYVGGVPTDLKDTNVEAKRSTTNIDKSAEDRDKVVEINSVQTYHVTGIIPYVPETNSPRGYWVKDTITGAEYVTVTDGINAGKVELTVTIGTGNSAKTSKYYGTVNGNTFSADLTAILGANADANKAIDIAYNATVKDIEVGNDVQIGDGQNDGRFGHGSDKLFTGNITLTKYASDTDNDGDGLLNNEKLAGAVFIVYKTGTNGKEYATFDNNNKFDSWVTEESGASKIVTGLDGTVKVEGLDLGTYYFKEIKAPEGYSVNTTDSSAELKLGANQTVADATISAGTHMIDTQLSSLPSTGGIGTTIFTIGGCLIMIVAAGLFFASRRKSAK